MSITFRRIIFLIAAAFCLTPLVSAPIALVLGLIMAWYPGHPYPEHNKKLTTILLQVSVVGLGFGMNFQAALKAGSEGFIFTLVSILGTMLVGILLGYLFKVDKKTSYLVSSGTAICGGSAIAAVSPIIDADENQLSVSLGIVFILNAVALLVFPLIGTATGLTQEQFGLWSAIAIHDTSSVVGAASRYGDKALEVATTVKLARALWIIPLALITTLIFRKNKGKIKIPYFIGFFILAMLASTYIPFVKSISPYITSVARAGLNLTLFLIGAGLSISKVRAVGARPFAQGTLLWLLISVIAFWAVYTFR